MKKTEIINSIVCGDSLDTLRKMPSSFVDCIVTSPPYYGQRDYAVDGQLGGEDTPFSCATEMDCGAETVLNKGTAYERVRKAKAVEVSFK